MHSAVLSDLREAEAAVVSVSQPSGFPDSSAVVGRVFQMRVPIKAKDSRGIVKVRGSSFKVHGILQNVLQMYANKFVLWCSADRPWYIR